ncbi:S-adenosyl-L-methionine-dependent methyltransferase [Hypoxylon sp. NC1633]|nr:S-adenosyl-L-methionine-dependent methyltransferase [Hypoxylon sp. NC1633]
MTGTKETEWSETTPEAAGLADFKVPGFEVDDVSETASPGKPPKNDSLVLDTSRPFNETGKYFLPNDEAELSRLNYQHAIWTTHLLDGDLFKAPLGEVSHVLDVGTGTGIWALEFAKAYSNAKVLGIDISKPSPLEVPPNCNFGVKDFTERWEYAQKFDLIHCRLLFTIPHDPRALMQQAYDWLEPGGYLEFHEMYGELMDFDGTVRGTALAKLSSSGVTAMHRLGNKNVLALPFFKQWMADVGFENVVELHRGLPCNGWPKGTHKLVGELQMKSASGMGDAYYHLLTKGLEMPPEEAAELVQKAAEDISNTNIHGYFPVFIVFGRKPLAS